MGKPIKITKEHLKEAKREFEEMLSSLKLSDGKISFSKTFGGNEEKTSVYFTSEAWVKMVALIHEFTDEVAWHGLAERSKKPDGYIIYDILVYPQEVSGSTVNTDQEKYQIWLMEHEDEVFNNIRMQGHSHVNMGVTPSAVDTNLYEKILDQLEDSMFYIFMVWNKKFESYTKIYDLQSNILYENDDIEVRLLDTGIGLDSFIANAKDMVSKKSYTAYNPNNWSGGRYSGHTFNSEIYDKNSKKGKEKTKVDGDKYSRSGVRSFDHLDYYEDDNSIYNLFRGGN